MKIAIIPARGESKRIPLKNIREFCGKPMIAWSIQAALKSKCFDRVIVSTDDHKIANIARNHGAEVPFQRPTDLTDDQTDISAIMHHALEWLEQKGEKPDLACCIYATAPFVTARSIRDGYKAIRDNDCDFALSVARYRYPIEKALRISQDQLHMVNPSQFNAKSRDFEVRYHDASQFYWGTRQAWLSEKAVLNSDAIPVILEPDSLQSIDTVEDWQRAEWKFRAMQMNAGTKAA